MYNKLIYHKQVNKLLGLIILSAFILAPGIAKAADVTISPNPILQGDPVMITALDGTLKNAVFDNKSYPAVTYGGVSRVLIGINILQKAGDYALTANFANGESINKTITIAIRPKPEIPVSVPVPDKLGDKTPQAEKALINSIAAENARLERAITGKKAFWTQGFIYPTAKPLVTNPYGYGVSTGKSVVAHRGTDLRAPVGTKIYAMNRGVVRFGRTFRAYGKTIVVDHGLGLQTLYLHMSRIYVNEGQLVRRGELIGLSGDTGFVSGPHLHLSVRVNKQSIDPVKFLELFGVSRPPEL